MSAAIIEARLREIQALALRSGSHEDFEHGVASLQASAEQLVRRMIEVSA